MGAKKGVRAVRPITYGGPERRSGKDRRVRGSDLFSRGAAERRRGGRRSGAVPAG